MGRGDFEQRPDRHALRPAGGAVTALLGLRAGLWLVYRLLNSLLLTVFVGLAALVVAAWLGVGWWVVLGAGALGLLAGAALSRRVWFGMEPPVVEPVLPEWRFPGVQDQFERLQARQRVLATVLIAALLMLVALRFVPERKWPTLFGVPRGRLLIGALAALAILFPLGILNWRCPHCRRNLGRSLVLRQCPNCGIVLRG